MVESRYDWVMAKSRAAWFTLCLGMDQIWLCFGEELQGADGEQTAFLNGAFLFPVSQIMGSPGQVGQQDLVSPITARAALCLTSGQIPKAGSRALVPACCRQTVSVRGEEC